MSGLFNDLLKQNMKGDTDPDAIGIRRICFYREKNLLEVTLHAPAVLSCPEYENIIAVVKEKTGTDLLLKIEADDTTVAAAEMHRYLSRLYETDPETGILSESVMNYDSVRRTLTFQYGEESESERASACAPNVAAMLQRIGAPDIHVSFDVIRREESVVMDIPLDAIPVPQEPAEAPVRKTNHSYYRTKMCDYTKVELRDIHDPVSDIQFDADVFAEETIETKKTKKMIQTLSVFDGTDAIAVKRFEGRNLTREEMAEIKTGDRIRIFGRVEFDTFANDLVCSAQSIEKLERVKETDTAEKKRLEFHMHTNMSEMDGVCDIKEIVN